MSSFSRHKKKHNNDVLQITNLEDDIEDISISNDTKPRTRNQSDKMSSSTNLQKRSSSEQNRTQSYPSVSEYLNSKKFDKDKKEGRETTTENPKVEKSAIINHVQTHSSSKSVSNSRGSSQASSSSGSSRDSFITSSNQKLPVSSVQINKRYTATPRIKNAKGFGHEEKDLFIDDLEDF